MRYLAFLIAATLSAAPDIREVAQQLRRLPLHFEPNREQTPAGVCFLARGAGVFTRANPMSTPRYRHTATLLASGQVLVIGGLARTGANPPATAQAELYDPDTNAWTLVGAMAEARGAHTATLLNDGRVLVAGGIDGTRSVGSVEIYNPVTRRFTRAGIGVARYFHTANLVRNGRVMIGGGRPGMNVAELVWPGAGE